MNTNATPCAELSAAICEPVIDYIDDLFLFGAIDNDERKRARETFTAELALAGDAEQRVNIASRWMSDLESYQAFKEAYR